MLLYGLVDRCERQQLLDSLITGSMSSDARSVRSMAQSSCCHLKTPPENKKIVLVLVENYVTKYGGNYGHYL